MIIHQSQSLRPPAGYYFFGYELAIDGDWAIVIAGTPSATPAHPQETHDALLYHRVNGVWTLDRTLVHRVSNVYGQSPYFVSVAMSNGLAAIGSNPTRIFKRTNNTWAEIAHPFTAPEGDPDFVWGDLHWDGNTLLATRSFCSYPPLPPWGGLISRLNADGSWSPLERLSSGDTYCDQEPVRWGISGNTVVAGTWSNDPELVPDQMHIFRRSGTTWMPTVAIDGGGGEGDVRGNDIFFSSHLQNGTAVYRNDDSLTVVDVIRTVSTSYADGWRSWGFTHTDDVFVQQGDVFRKNAAGKYEHVAILKPRGPYGLSDDVRISGRRAISQAYRSYTSSNQAALIFDLPATYVPSRVVATGFENGAPPVNPQLGTFAVVTKPYGNHVYRQSSLVGGYKALLANTDWEEQSIEADVKPTAFSGSSEEWAGLAVRHLDAANYYAVALRSTGVVELRFMRNGVSTVMVQKPLAIVAGRTYHVSLQAYGTMITVRINNGEFLWWDEEKPVGHGSAALLGNQTTADYDNVVVAQVGQRPIFSLFNAGCYGPVTPDRTPFWRTVGTASWNCASGTENVMQQTSSAGDARAIVGTPTDDQIVTTRVRATAFADSKDRWFGIAARYVDDSNYYFLTVRNSNTLSLRKVVNGVVTVLGTVPFTVTPNTWYDLRLDAVGNELRGIINRAQVLTATDSSHASGQGAILTYKAAAEYVNYRAWQP
jgi:hypothetical protein